MNAELSLPSSDDESKSGGIFRLGPAVLNLKQNTGRIRITVDPGVLEPRVEVRTKASRGPAAQAVRNARFETVGIQINVTVPDEDLQSGGTVIFGNVSGVVINVGGRVTVNGRDVTSELRKNAEPEIETVAVLPPGSWVNLTTQSSDAEVHGTPESVVYSGASGSLRVDATKDLEVDLSSGTVTVSRVEGEMDVNVSSGSFRVSRYEGRTAKVRVSSGSVQVAAAPTSSGTFVARVSSGSFRLTGSGHLNVQKFCSSGVLSVS